MSRCDERPNQQIIILPSFDILVSNNNECVDTPIPNVYI
jgi:hypothetical protein